MHSFIPNLTLIHAVTTVDVLSLEYKEEYATLFPESIHVSRYIECIIEHLLCIHPIALYVHVSILYAISRLCKAFMQFRDYIGQLCNLNIWYAKSRFRDCINSEITRL